MKKLRRYELYEDVNNKASLRKRKCGEVVHIKDLIKYLKSFDENEEIIKVMDHIIRTQLSE